MVIFIIVIVIIFITVIMKAVDAGGHSRHNSGYDRHGHSSSHSFHSADTGSDTSLGSGCSDDDDAGRRGYYDYSGDSGRGSDSGGSSSDSGGSSSDSGGSGGSDSGSSGGGGCD